MKPTTEWLLTVVGGVLGGSFGLLLGYGITMFVASANPFNPILVLFCIGTIVLGALGAVKGGKVAGRFIDRTNPPRDN